LHSSFVVRSYRSLRLRLPQPWSRRIGQLAYLPKLLRGHSDTRREFAEEPLIEHLAVTREPLAGVGAGMSERVIEIPWVLRRLTEQFDQHVLDVGTAFSPMVYKRLLVRQPHRIQVVDLAETNIPGLPSAVADVRKLPFRADDFDLAVCISTLEHIGMDNTRYEIESGGGGDVDALRELGRVARRVLVTVPGGADANMGWQRQYSPSAFRRIVDRAGLKVERLEAFAHDPAGGWAPVGEDVVASRSYGEDAVAAAASICAELSRR
jgi:hypothetical protein